MNKKIEYQLEIDKLHAELKEVMLFFASSKVPNVIMDIIEHVPDEIKNKIKELEVKVK